MPLALADPSAVLMAAQPDPEILLRSERSTNVSPAAELITISGLEFRSGTNTAASGVRTARLGDGIRVSGSRRAARVGSGGGVCPVEDRRPGRGVPRPGRR